MIALKLLIWFAFIFGHAYRDYWLITIKNKKPVYWKSFLFIRAPAGLLYLFLLWDWHNLLYSLNYILFECISFWIMFPDTLNVMRGKNPLYLGKNSGWIDSHFIKHPTQFRIALILAWILFILSVIVIYQR